MPVWRFQNLLLQRVLRHVFSSQCPRPCCWQINKKCKGGKIHYELIGCSGGEEFNAKPFHFDQLQLQVEGVIKSSPCRIFLKSCPCRISLQDHRASFWLLYMESSKTRYSKAKQMPRFVYFSINMKTFCCTL